MWLGIDNIKVFSDTLDRCGRNAYLKKSIQSSVQNQYVLPHEEDISVQRNFPGTEAELVSRRSIEAASGLSGRTAVLNFADYYVPGGLVKYGAYTQEESICRVTTLYPCITDPGVYGLFYSRHQGCDDSLYTDDLIYTPDVTVFKEDAEPYGMLERDQWYKVDVITCAAPNLSGCRIVDEEQYRVLKGRIGRLIAAASTNMVDTLVLGAFGCGAFGCDPVIAARAFSDSIGENDGAVGKVLFAVPGNRADPNFAAFEKQFG